MYKDADFDKTLELIDTTTEYALTGAMYVFVDSTLLIPPSVSRVDGLLRSVRSPESNEQASSCGGEYLLQRKVHWSRRRTTTVWWRVPREHRALLSICQRQGD